MPLRLAWRGQRLSDKPEPPPPVSISRRPTRAWQTRTRCLPSPILAWRVHAVTGGVCRRGSRSRSPGDRAAGDSESAGGSLLSGSLSRTPPGREALHRQDLGVSGYHRLSPGSQAPCQLAPRPATGHTHRLRAGLDSGKTRDIWAGQHASHLNVKFRLRVKMPKNNSRPPTVGLAGGAKPTRSCAWARNTL